MCTIELKWLKALVYERSRDKLIEGIKGMNREMD